MKGFGDLYKSKKQKNKNTELSEKDISQKAFTFHSKGNIQEATKYYQLYINQGFKDARVFYNYGTRWRT